MSATFHVYRLQQIDSQIDRIQKRLNEIQKIIDDNAELKRVKIYLAHCEKDYQNTEKNLKKAESEVKQQHIKIEQTESMLYGGSLKNPKEIQDLQNKAESLKRYLSKLQDEQIEAMLAHEEQTEILQAAQLTLKELRAKLTQQNSQLAGEQTVLNREKERYLTERDVAQPAVDPHLLKKYMQLRKTKNGVAVASMIDGSCSACGAQFTHSQQQSARSTADISYCPSCQRIVYAN